MKDSSNEGGVLGSAAASVTDLLAGFLAVFLILFVAAQNQRAKGPVQVRNAIAEKIRAELAADSLQIEVHPRDSAALLIVMPNELLFDEGSSGLRSGGVVKLRNISPKIARVLCGTWSDSVSLTVEGHTDAVPGPRALLRGVTETFDGRLANLLLSQARASAVSATIVESVSDSTDLGCLYRIVSASGRGQEEPHNGRPRAATDTLRAEPLDRRVWLIIRVTRGVEHALRSAVAPAPVR